VFGKLLPQTSPAAEQAHGSNLQASGAPAFSSQDSVQLSCKVGISPSLPQLINTLPSSPQTGANVDAHTYQCKNSEFRQLVFVLPFDNNPSAHKKSNIQTQENDLQQQQLPCTRIA
jgi:hypothetical protein